MPAGSYSSASQTGAGLGQYIQKVSFQHVLKRHMWLLATVLARATLEADPPTSRTPA